MVYRETLAVFYDAKCNTLDISVSYNRQQGEYMKDLCCTVDIHLHFYKKYTGHILKSGLSLVYLSLA